MATKILLIGQAEVAFGTAHRKGGGNVPIVHVTLHVTEPGQPLRALERVTFPLDRARGFVEMLQAAIAAAEAQPPASAH